MIKVRVTWVDWSPACGPSLDQMLWQARGYTEDSEQVRMLLTRAEVGSVDAATAWATDAYLTLPVERVTIIEESEA